MAGSCSKVSAVHSPWSPVAGKADAGRSPSIRVPPGTDSATLDLVLAPTTGLDGKVTRGKPAADVVIIANPIGVVGSNFLTTTGPAGTFALDAIAPGAYIVYPMFGGGGPRPKDMYTRRAIVVTRKHDKIDIDATPDTLALTVNVKGPAGAAAMAQVIVVEAAVDPVNLEDLRDSAGMPFSETVIPIYMRRSRRGHGDATGYSHRLCGVEGAVQVRADQGRCGAAQSASSS